MINLKKFQSLPPADQYLLIVSTLLLGGIRVGLWLLPLRLLWHLLAQIRLAFSGVRPVNRPPIERIRWAVTVASQYIPAATCLTQALATQTLLAWWSYPAHLYIGVAQSSAGQIEAHAWVASQGKVVSGGTDQDILIYTPLPLLEEQLRKHL